MIQPGLNQVAETGKQSQSLWPTRWLSLLITQSPGQNRPVRHLYSLQL